MLIMATSIGSIFLLRHRMCFSILKPICRDFTKLQGLRILSVCDQRKNPFDNNVLSNKHKYGNYFTHPGICKYSNIPKNNADKISKECPSESTNNVTLIQRFKQMYRDYWYVLVPVHLATSIMWLGGFYYSVRSGLDVVSLLQSLNIPEKFITPFRDSTTGYYAVTFALYKIAAPLRYAVTLGLTTVTINRLTAFGLIKPVPSRERIKEILQEKKDVLQEKYEERRVKVIDNLKRKND